MDYQGEVYAIAKWAGVKTRQVRERLGDESHLPSVADVKEQMADVMLARLDAFQGQIDGAKQELAADFEKRRKALVQRQRTKRQALKEMLEKRREAEAVQRQGRFRKGLAGIWDRLRGEHRRIRKLNEREAEAAAVRDRTEWDSLVFRQLDQRRQLNIFRLKARCGYERERLEIEQDMEAYRKVREHALEPPHRSRRRREGPAPER